MTSSSNKSAVQKAAAKGKRVTGKPKTAPAGEEQFTDRTGGLYGLPPGCPVIPLGVHGNMRYYLDAHNQRRDLSNSDHTRTNLLGLFSDKIEYVYSVRDWTRRNKDGDLRVRPERLAEDLMVASGRAGLWDPMDNERGRGAWRGAQDELILHTGDKVMVFGTTDAWGLRMVQQPGLIGRCLYAAGEPTAEPAPNPPEDGSDPAATLLEILSTWNWRRGDLDAVLFLGWIGAAMIGGALKWRPSAWLTGGKGTGKTTLQSLVTHVMGGKNSLISLQNTTAAGVYQTLRHQTLPVAIDEMEAGEDNRRTAGVVEIARLSASGGTMARGSDKSVPVNFTLRSCFLFSSVLVPPLLGTDRSRLAILDLDELPPDAPAPDLNEARLRAIGAQLRRRIVSEWARHDSTVKYYIAQLTAGGHSKRGAEQFGTLLACADMLLFQGATDKILASDWVARMHAADLAETADDVRDEEQCWQTLLATPIDAYRRGEKVNIGEWINRAAGRVKAWDDVAEAGRILQSHGIRVESFLVGTRTSRWVAVANAHAVLAGLFERTRWTAPRGVQGVWGQALRRLPGAERSGKALYFGGATSRAVLIPFDRVPMPDDPQNGGNPFEPEPRNPPLI